MGVIDVKNVRYSYGKFIVVGGNSGGEGGNLTPEDWEKINQQVEQEVANQMAIHDESVHDTHNMPAQDKNDYPDVTIFNENN